MSSLSQLLTEHRSLLVFDACSTQTQVGLLRADSETLWHSSMEEAGRAIFTLSEALLSTSKLTLKDIGAFVYCEGPGSMLGVRTVAMALRTWKTLHPRPSFSYQSLAVAAHFNWANHGHRDFSVIADARRETWHLQQITVEGHLANLRRMPVVDLPKQELVILENFRTWSKPPSSTTLCSYDLRKIFASLGQGDFFRQADEPETFQHEAPDYKKSPAQIHSIATAEKR